MLRIIRQIIKVYIYYIFSTETPACSYGRLSGDRDRFSLAGVGSLFDNDDPPLRPRGDIGASRSSLKLTPVALATGTDILELHLLFGGGLGFITPDITYKYRVLN